jgi:lipopolysaccharide/colanic/teichoic acid biosynthesis glycosyltransferase
VSQFREVIPEYDKRLSVKPGITGLAQVRAGYDRTLRDVRRKVKLDLMYIHRMCWWVDFVIFFGTFARVFRGGTERRGNSETRDLAEGAADEKTSLDSAYGSIEGREA